jgi:DNA-binding transcriptional LysR family regulator
MLHNRMLTYLDEVARAGSIRKAAGRLNVAASAVSRQILALEEDLGTPLFLRLPRRLVLTAAGEVLIRHVRSTLREQEIARAKIEELKGLRRGEITVALMSGLAGNLVPRALTEFRQSNPRVKLQLTLLPTGEAIQQAILAGDADLGLGFDFPARPGIRTLATSVGRLGAVVATGHPLTELDSVRLSDCIDYPLIVADATMVIRPYLDAAFARARLPLDPMMETNSIEVMRQMAILGDAVTFLTVHDMDFERRAGRLALAPVRELTAQTQTLMLLGHDRGPSAIASVLVENVKSLLSAAT